MCIRDSYSILPCSFHAVISLPFFLLSKGIHSFYFLILLFMRSSETFTRHVNLSFWFFQIFLCKLPLYSFIYISNRKLLDKSKTQSPKSRLGLSFGHTFLLISHYSLSLVPVLPSLVLYNLILTSFFIFVFHNFPFSGLCRVLICPVRLDMSLLLPHFLLVLLHFNL